MRQQPEFNVVLETIFGTKLFRPEVSKEHSFLSISRMDVGPRANEFFMVYYASKIVQTK